MEKSFILPPIPGCAHDQLYNATTQEFGVETALTPCSKDFQTCEEYSRALNEWYARLDGRFHDVMLPNPVSLFFRRPVKAEKITAASGRSIYGDQMLEMNRRVLNGEGVNEGDNFEVPVNRTAVPMTDFMKNEPEWRGTLVSGVPEPEFCDSYEAFEKAQDLWMKKSKELLKEEALPQNPRKLEGIGGLEVVPNKPVYEVTEQTEWQPTGKYLWDRKDLRPFTAENYFKHLVGEKKVKVQYIPDREVPPELFEFGCDAPIVTPYNFKEGQILSIKEVTWLWNMDPRHLSVQSKMEMINTIITFMSQKKISTILMWFNRIEYFYKCLVVCSEFSKVPLNLFEPDFKAVEKVTDGLIVHGYRTVMSYFLFKTFYHFLSENGHDAAAAVIEPYRTSSQQQVVQYLQTFETNLFTWVRNNLNEENIGMVVSLLRAIYRGDPEFAGRMIKIFEDDQFSLLNEVSRYSVKSFGQLFFDIVANKEIMIRYFNRYTQLLFCDNLTPLMTEFLANLISIDLKYEPVKEALLGLLGPVQHIDTAWAVSWIGQFGKSMIPQNRVENSYLLWQVARFLERAMKAHLLKPEPFLNDYQKIITAMIVLIQSIDVEKIEMRVNILKALASLCSCRYSIPIVTKSVEWSHVLNCGITDSVEISNAFWKIVRRIFVRHPTTITKILQSQMWVPKLSQVFTECRVDQTFGIFKTLQKLFLKRVPPDEKVEDEVQNVGLIFMLSAVPDDIVAFLQLMSDNGFKPYSLAQQFVKMEEYKKEQAVVLELFRVLGRRKSCLQLVTKTGRKGHTLSAVAKPKFHRPKSKPVAVAPKDGSSSSM